MSEQRLKRTETEDTSRVDNLLGLLGHLSQRDPTPHLREQLGTLAARRLGENSANAPRPDRMRPRMLVWLKPALAAAFLVAIGLVTALVAHFRPHEPAPGGRTAKVSPLAVSPENKTHATVVPGLSIAKPPKTHRAQSTLPEPAGTRRITMQLPYSNSAIENGTDTTIRVAMSQSELLSLGFPINATIQDKRIVADLTLGDDGLPRAISLPLPLEVMPLVMKEKQ